MNASDHLTKDQIAGFAAKALTADESRKVGGHILRCFDCRSLLPLPDPRQFWAAVTNDRDSEEALDSADDPASVKSYSQAFGPLFTKPRNLAWGTGALIVVISLAILAVLRVANENRVEAEVAQTFEDGRPSSLPFDNGREAPEANLPAREKSTPAREPIRAASLNKRPSQPSKNEPRGNRTGKGQLRAKLSSVRGRTGTCGAEGEVEMELESHEANLVLKWKRVPKAVKYHLYISDYNEVLVDEFETKSATTYVLKKPLDPTKFYKWKILITLENGQTLNVNAQKFSVRDFQSRSEGFRSRAKSNTRCLAN